MFVLGHGGLYPNYSRAWERWLSSVGPFGDSLSEAGAAMQEAEPQLPDWARLALIRSDCGS